MLDFTYLIPTKVLFGRGVENKAGALLKEYGCKKVLLHYGGNSAKKTGLFDRIVNSLNENAIAYVELGGVVPNPRLSKVYEGVKLCKRENVDFILAVGGGSVIDSAKAISFGAANDFDVWDVFEGKATVKAALPVGSVLTIAAAGSEMSSRVVITNENGWLKRGAASDFAFCKFSLLNPELTMTLPAYQTASGATDILMHTLERYFSTPNSMEITDGFSEALLRTVMQYTRIALKDPTNYEARAELMWASSLSHNGLLTCGNDGGDWASHQLEHELGGMFDVAHGAGLAAVWASWARYVYKQRPERFARYAKNVFGIDYASGQEEEAALKGIAATEDFFRSISMPTNIRELGYELTDAQINELAHKCVYMGKRKVGKFMVLDEAAIREIYQLAR